MSRIASDEFDQLLLGERPLVDLRAPSEFVKGAFPNSISLPLMTDNERHQVGTCYKEHGQDAAITLGHTLVSGEIKAQRMEAWIEQVRTFPNTVLYCFRGGLRSHITQAWLAEAGYDVPIITGGYKALRQHCLKRLETIMADVPLLVLSGRTGTGKTQVLRHFKHVIDLEGLAHHRGSSFGKHWDAQPSQINFESHLTVALLGQVARQASTLTPQLAPTKHPKQPLVVEDESRLIGRCALPLCFQGAMKSAPIMVLEDDFDTRVNRIVEEYVMQAHHVLIERGHTPREAHDQLGERLLESLGNIRRRLGNQDYPLAEQMLREALQSDIPEQLGTCQHDVSDDKMLHKHKQWVTFLLKKYYDPMYDFQLNKKQSRVLVRGHAQQLIAWYLTNGSSFAPRSKD